MTLLTAEFATEKEKKDHLPDSDEKIHFMPFLFRVSMMISEYFSPHFMPSPSSLFSCLLCSLKCICMKQTSI